MKHLINAWRRGQSPFFTDEILDYGHVTSDKCGRNFLMTLRQLSLPGRHTTPKNAIDIRQKHVKCIIIITLMLCKVASSKHALRELISR
jgi:hypothetical protein